MHSATQANAVSIIDVNGKPFASGLYWQTLHSPISFLKEAKTYGRQNAMHVFAVRKTRLVIQAGYASASAGQLKGKRSLAAALANVLGDNWIGAFAVDVDTYALVAVLDGGVMPGRDIVGPFETIQSMLCETVALVEASNGEKSFERCIAPVEFKVGDETLTLETLLIGPGMRSAARLRPVVFTLPNKKTLLVAATSVAVVVAALAVLLVIHKRRIESDALRSAALERARQQLTSANPAKIPTSIRAPWELSASATTMAHACDAGMDLPLSLGGWILTQATCAGNEVHGSYVRHEYGSLASFRAEARRVLASDIDAYDNGNRATLAVRLAAVPLDTHAPATDSDATITFVSYFQRLNIEARLTENNAVKLQPPAEANAPIPWKSYAFTVESDIAPSAVLDDLKLNGLRINSITMTVHNNARPALKWAIAGDLYVLR